MTDRGDISDSFGISTRLLVAKHDLIHKAKGRMWREAGKVDKKFARADLSNLGAIRVIVLFANTAGE